MEPVGRSERKMRIGFRDIEAFNKALLAKQIWKMLQNLSTLVAQIMKHKYFKNDEVLEAKIGYQSSYAWRSLCSTIDLVKAIMYWRVGNGQRVNMWKDK